MHESSDLTLLGSRSAIAVYFCPNSPSSFFDLATESGHKLKQAQNGS